MSPDRPAPSKPARRRRRWPLLVGLVLLVPVLLVAALPWLLNSSAGNRLVASRLDRVFEPGRLRFESIRFGWTSPTRLTGVRLDDPGGKTVLTAPSATLTPSLWGFLTRPKRLGTLALEGAAFEVERRADGSIDLADALGGVFRDPDPERDLTIRADAATLRLRSEGLAGPMVAERMDLVVRLRPSPETATWSVDLARAGDESMRITGQFDRWSSRPTSKVAPDLDLDVDSNRWSLAAKAGDVEVSGRLGGKVAVSRVAGRWRVVGKGELAGLEASGPSLEGDRPALASLAFDASVGVGDGEWSVDRFEATSPLGSLSAILPSPADPSRPPRVEGRVDLAALARQIPHTLRLRDGLAVESGTARLALSTSRPTADRSEWTLEARLSDLAARQGDRRLTLRDPATLTALVVRDRDSLSVDRLAIKTAFLDATARGDLDRGIDLGGTVDLAALRLQAADWIDVGRADLGGRGTFTARYRRDGLGYTAESRVDLAGLRLGSGQGSETKAEFTAGIEGQVGPSGLPRSVTRGEIGFVSGELSAHARARPDAGGTSLKLDAHAPIGLADRRAVAEGSLSGRWDGGSRSMAIDDLTLGLKPGRNEAKVTPLAWSASGRLDVAEGSLTLTPTGADNARSPIALAPEGIRIVGLGGPADSLRVDAGWVGDIAALDSCLAAWTGRPPRGLAGRWTATASVEPGDDRLTVAARLGVADFSWPGRDGGRRAGSPVTLSARSTYRPTAHRLDVAELAVVTPLGTIQAAGTIDAIDGPARADLKGVLAPNWEALTALLADRVEPGARVAGRARAFRLTGPLQSAGDSGPLEAEIGIDLTALDVFGMRLGATPIVVRSRGRSIAVDPIETRLNDGRLHLEPVIDLDDEGGPAILLGKESSLTGAVVNEEVSRRVLSYVAPVLDRTTRASGRVSVALEEADFPIAGDPGRKASVTGSVIFQDVEFAPGPLARDVMGLFRMEDSGNLRLDAPVLLSIADGRVNQRGLAIPIGKNLTQLEVEGWVDFDKNLGLVASVPVTRAMLGDRPILGDIVAGTRIRIPIGGTLAAPRFDKDAFNVAMKDELRGLLTRGAGLGALDLLNGLARPRAKDPDAPPPPTAEEKKARRIEKRNDRRRARGVDPLPMPGRP